MQLDTRLSVPPQVMSRMVGDETVLLDLASGVYFGLDGVGQANLGIRGRRQQSRAGRRGHRQSNTTWMRRRLRRTCWSSRATSSNVACLAL